jgi:NAD(P)-dependent dehydrogenase (short-subunit alcohol dehydrogenase family)
MADFGAVVVTGASGSLATSMVDAIRSACGTRFIAVGRRRPKWLSVHDLHLEADFANLESVDAVAVTIDGLGVRPWAALFLAGIDSRFGIGEVEPAVARRAVEVNCVSHLMLLRRLLYGRRARNILRVALASSDVVGSPTPHSVVYAMSKAALEEGIRQAGADGEGRMLRTLVVRLSFTGVSMRELAERTAPPIITDVPDAESCDAAVAATARFLAADNPSTLPPFELWQARAWQGAS